MTGPCLSPAAWGEEGESPRILPMTLSQLPPCNSHCDALGTWGPGRGVGATRQGAGHRAAPPHPGKPGSQALNQQHPGAGGRPAGPRQSRSTKMLWGLGGGGGGGGGMRVPEGAGLRQSRGGERRLFRQMSSWQAAAWYVYPGRCYKSSLRLNAATAEVAVIRSAHSEILIKGKPEPQRQGARRADAPLGHTPACSVPAGDAGPAQPTPPLPASAPSALPAPPPPLPRLPASCPEPRPALSLRRALPARARGSGRVLPASPWGAGPPSPLQLSGGGAAAGSWGAMPAAGHRWPLQPSAPGGPQAPAQPGRPQGCWQRSQRLQARAVSAAAKDRLPLSPVTIRSPWRLPKPDLGGLGLEGGQ